MEYVTLGRTGLRVSVAGLGCGGFSRLGMTTGKTEAESIALIHLALDLGINLIDTAASYNTEAVVGAAIKSVPRDSIVVTTKSAIHRGEQKLTPQEVVASLDNSLRLLGTPYVDVFQLHGVLTPMYDYAQETILPALLKEQAKGKLRYVGITEPAPADTSHDMLRRAVLSKAWDSVMIAFHMMHQNARAELFQSTMKNRVGTLMMFAVRNIFARPERVAAVLRDLAAHGKVPDTLANSDDPLGFLVHPGGASSITDAAYRFVRYEPGVDVVLFGTGDPAHLRENVASLLKPPLPDADRQKLITLFGHLVGVGLDRPTRTPKPPTAG
jgi:aryl-alcohol dehydrogenase-like predicted oxidoreductase